MLNVLYKKTLKKIKSQWTKYGHFCKWLKISILREGWNCFVLRIALHFHTGLHNGFPYGNSGFFSHGLSYHYCVVVVPQRKVFLQVKPAFIF